MRANYMCLILDTTREIEWNVIFSRKLHKNIFTLCSLFDCFAVRVKFHGKLHSLWKTKIKSTRFLFKPEKSFVFSVWSDNINWKERNTKCAKHCSCPKIWSYLSTYYIEANLIIFMCYSYVSPYSVCQLSHL